ncbi:MAG TPA: lysophospholipid acyltransferase family protein [Candidatus Dormibacteraeota bacterium]|nr:lysophospholipid acyltransferase family protein [Candidatus Dormibacteraeota bacterium]
MTSSPDSPLPQGEGEGEGIARDRPAARATSPASDQPPAAPPTVRERLELLVFHAAIGAFALLPRRLALRVGAWLGDLFYLLDRRDRAIALINLGIAFPDKTPAERRALLRASVRNLGRTAAEICHFGSLTPATVRDYVTIEEPARWKAALDRAAQCGTLILTGHFGNWELLAYACGLLGHPITLVHRQMNNVLVDDAITDIRERAGTVSLTKKRAAKAALRALYRHRIVAIAADQNQTRRYGVFADLFGLPASTTPGPARLAMLSGAPVVPVFLVREGDSDQHRIVVLPEVEMVKTADREADVIENTRRCNAVFETMLRRYPEQWIWFHKRWKTRPIGDPRIY